MVVYQYGINYAVHIITNHFGNLVSKVCECLLRKGPLTLQSITRYTELKALQVKNSLLVLIQHNCLQAFVLEQPGTFGEGPKLNTHYMVLFDNIINRARFPKFLKIVAKEHDQQCLEVLEGLLQHGRLTVKQIFDRATSNQKQGIAVVPDAIREALLKLVSAHYVERCPASEPVLTMPSEETAANKRRPKSAKIIVETETLEQRVLAEAMPMEGIRFSVITNTEPDVDGENDENDSISMIVGVKRKHDALESDRESGATDEHVLWRVNFEEFIRRLRHRACVENVRVRLDDGAATVLSAMLEATRSEEKKVKVERSGGINCAEKIWEGRLQNV